MTHRKFCCDGLNALKIKNLWPVFRNKVKWYTALYKCQICGEYSIRGETNQKTSHSTFVDLITKEEAEDYIKQADQKWTEKSVDISGADLITVR